MVTFPPRWITATLQGQVVCGSRALFDPCTVVRAQTRERFHPTTNPNKPFY